MSNTIRNVAQLAGCTLDLPRSLFGSNDKDATRPRETDPEEHEIAGLAEYGVVLALACTHPYVSSAFHPDLDVDALAQLNTSLAGRYVIEREIGRGGMATVYLARDVRHNRNVALKVLSPELGAVVGVERFLSEIQVTANLQHPNLLPLFDSGEADGLLFYVMPYVEGESLRKRLQREKQLPIDETIRLGTSVASALDYAHRHGVIHRDLKPENILLHEGQPLVADFGIALAVSIAGGERITQTGISLGTPHYMSPEQATGDRAIDGRTDIYSLGAVLYEALSGDPPHTASTAQAVIAKVITDKPRSVRLMRPNVPAHVDAAIDRALEKLPADRWSTAHEFAEALQGRGVSVPSHVVTPGSAQSDVSRQPLGARASRVLPWFVALAALGAAGMALWMAAAPREPGRTVRFLLSFPPNQRLRAANARDIAISNDGSRVAFVTVGGGRAPQIVVRTLDDITSRPIPGADGFNPFFSPDGKWIGFVQGTELRKVPVDGGPAMLIGDVGQTFGASWLPDDRIVFANGSGIATIAANGAGQVKLLTKADPAHPAGYRWPHALPDGKTIVFTRWTGSMSSAKLRVASLETGEVRDLGITGMSPLGMVDGHLLFASAADALFAVPFDMARLRSTGPPVLVASEVFVGATGFAMADASPNGSLVYQVGSASSTLVLVDSAGTSKPVIPEPRPLSFPRYSPDGSRIAIAVRGVNSTDIHIYSLASGTLTRLTTDGVTNDRPEWTPDGKRVLYRSERAEGLSLWWQSTDFTGVAEPLQAASRGGVWEGIVSPDGSTLVYRVGTTPSGDIFARRLHGDTTSRPVANTPFSEWGARLSPDGKWIAYQSDESRAFEVYVRPFAGPGARVQVSVDGGTGALWSRDGKRIFYISNQRLLAATVRTSPTFAVTSRKQLLELDFVDLPGHPNYDVAPDGKHFLMLRPSVGGDQVVVVHNWRAELRQRLRTPH